MSENIQSISNGTFTLGSTSATNFVAGPGIKIDQPSEGVVRIGNDETVLWSGTRTSACTLSEPATNFNSIRIVKSMGTDTIVETNKYYVGFCDNVSNDGICYWCVGRFIVNGKSITVNKSKTMSIGNWTATSTALTVTNNWDYGTNIITKVIGINRISGSNA